MEQEWLNVLDGFESVWERVINNHSAGGQETPSAPVDETAAEMEAILMELNGLWESYRVFARQTAGEAQKRFLALAEETRNSVRALQTEYFLKMGEVYHPNVADLPKSGVLTGMRRAYQTEQRLAKRLVESSGLAETASRHTQVLRDMITSLLTK